MNTPDQRIDQLLHALGNSAVPAGLEQRVNARLAQYVENHGRNRSLFKRIGGFLWTPDATNLATRLSVATAVVIVLGAASLFHFAHRRPQLVGLASAPALPSQPPAQDASSARFLRNRRGAISPSLKVVAEPQASFSTNDDSDATALAETFAPSHVAPPMPLSAQETAMSRSIRRITPIEVAMFDAQYEPVASALASARERATVREYVHGLLGPLVTAQSLTTSSPRTDDAPPVADPESSTSK